MAEKVFPYLGTSEERLAAEMNAQSGLSLIFGTDFVFDSLAAEVGPEGRNTIIRVVPMDADYSPSWHRYTRLDIGILANLRGTARIDPFIFEGQEGSEISLHSLLGEINTQLGLNLVGEEVSNYYFTLGEPGVSFQLRLEITQSVAWLPNSFFEFEASFYQP